MSIPLRFPEGQPNRCPVCGSAVRSNRSIVIGDTGCRSCGHKLWFLGHGLEARFFVSSISGELRDRICDRIAEQLGVREDEVPNNPDLQFLGADSLDKLEWIMEIEEEMGLGGPPTQW